MHVLAPHIVTEQTQATFASCCQGSSCHSRAGHLTESRTEEVRETVCGGACLTSTTLEPSIRSGRACASTCAEGVRHCAKNRRFCGSGCGNGCNLPVIPRKRCGNGVEAVGNHHIIRGSGRNKNEKEPSYYSSLFFPPLPRIIWWFTTASTPFPHRFRGIICKLRPFPQPFPQNTSFCSCAGKFSRKIPTFSYQSQSPQHHLMKSAF